MSAMMHDDGTVRKQKSSSNLVPQLNLKMRLREQANNEDICKF
jgi:hypothetical protein